MSIRAKMMVRTVTKDEYDQEIVKLSAVASGNPEDNGFAKATPAGTLEMVVSNPKAHGFFVPGASYYLDLTKAAVLAILLFIGALTLSSSARAQTATNEPPASTLWDFLTTGSNYWAAPFATYSVNSRELGGGIALGYKVSDVVNPVVRMDYFANRLYMVSLNAELQVPRSIMGKIPVTPFAIGGVATGLSGLGQDNGTAIGIVGAGAYSALTYVGSGWFWQHTAIVADYERWIGLPTKQSDQVRFGIAIRF